MQDYDENPNPFRSDVDETPSSGQVHSDSSPMASPVLLEDDGGFADVMATPQPPAKRALSDEPPTPVAKTDFCCTRDQFLHSGDEAEIQVLRFTFHFH